MAAAHDPVILDYDAENDVLRAFVEKPSADALAVPRGGVTVIVTEDLDRPIGIVVEPFLARHPAAENLRDATARAAYFQGERHHLSVVMSLLIQSVAPLAKDDAARWMEIVGA